MISTSYADAASLPRLVYPDPQRHPNLVGVVFEFMKRLPAHFCVRRALEPVGRLALTPEGYFDEVPAGTQPSLLAEREGERVFIETSSGNMGAGLAEICNEYGLKLHLLLPLSVDEGTRRFVAEMGATVEDIDTVDQNARVARLQQIKQRYEAQGWQVTWVAQYENQNNPLAYWRLAELLAGELDRIDCLVGPVGTGGSTGGTARFLRRAGFPDLKLVGVDAAGSVNFGHGGGDYLLGGLGSDRPMPLVDLDAYDVVHWFDDTTAFATAVALAKRGLPVGGSSGAAYAAAAFEASAAPSETVVVILPDHARRYESTFRSPDWRAAHGIDLGAAHGQPISVDDPAASDPGRGAVRAWYRIDWRAYRNAAGGTGRTDDATTCPS